MYLSSQDDDMGMCVPAVPNLRRVDFNFQRLLMIDSVCNESSSGASLYKLSCKLTGE